MDHCAADRFKYEPAILRDALFDPHAFGRRPHQKSSNLHHRPHKRRRLDHAVTRSRNEDEEVVDDDDEEDEDEPRDIVLETLTERFLVQAYDELTNADHAEGTSASSVDKENVDVGMDVDSGATGADDLELELGVPPPFMPLKPMPERRWVISLVVDEDGEDEGAVEVQEAKVSEEKVPEEPEATVADSEGAASKEVPPALAPASEIDEKAKETDTTPVPTAPQPSTTDAPVPPPSTTSDKQPTPPLPVAEAGTLAVTANDGNKDEASPSAQPSPLPALPPPSPTVSNLSVTSDPDRAKTFSSSTASKPNSKSTITGKKVRIAPEALLPVKPKDEQWKKKAKVLQRDLTAANFDFVKGEVRVLGDVDEDGTRKGWAIEVRRWWWA